MKISVVTTLRNAVETIGDCLDSVAAQTHAQRELIVMDGASEDSSPALLQQRGDQLAVLVSEPDGGTYFGLNKGITRATGEVVGLLHADDVYADPQVLARVAAAFADPAVQAVYGDLQYVARKSWRITGPCGRMAWVGSGPWRGRISPSCRSLCGGEALVIPAACRMSSVPH